MEKTKISDTIDKNLDKLASFLNLQLQDSTLAMEIPSGAHIFHGSHNDSDLTQNNLKLAANIWLGMKLGYVEDAPLVMIFEQEMENYTVIDLSATLQIDMAQSLITQFQEQSLQRMSAKLEALSSI